MIPCDVFMSEFLYTAQDFAQFRIIKKDWIRPDREALVQIDSFVVRLRPDSIVIDFIRKARISWMTNGNDQLRQDL